jgi:hypothetical protein
MTNSTFHLGIFYMLQIYDLGPTALLPLQRKVRWEFFRPEKSWRLQPGLNPRTWVLKGSMLPLDHRSRSCATSRTILGSIPSGVTGFFSDVSPSDCTMALGSTQPLVKMSTRYIPGGKGGRCVRLTTSPPSHADVMKSGSLKFLQPSGPHQASYGTPLPLSFLHFKTSYQHDLSVLIRGIANLSHMQLNIAEI